MKIMRPISIVAVVLLVVSGFLPWVYIDFGTLHHATLTGMDTGATNYGKPALLSIIFAVLFFITIWISKVWVKRTGLFLGVLILAWNLRNFFLFQCEMGYCPEKRIGLYLALLSAIAIMICAALPYVPDKREGDR